MYVNKTVCTCIKLTTNDTLTFNGYKTLDEMLINIITKKYVNRCYKKAFILKINKILVRSQVFEDVHDINGDGMLVNVTFEFYGETFNTNDIIPRCKLVKIQSFGRYDCVVDNKPYIKIAINQHDIIKHLEVGDSFPCIIGSASLKTISQDVIIKAIPFCNQYQHQIYNILDNKSEFRTITLNDDIDDSVSTTSSHRRRKEWFEHPTYISLFSKITNLYNENINDKNFKFFLELMTVKDQTDKVSDLKKWNEIVIGDYVKTNPTNYDKTCKIVNADTNAVPIKQKEFLLKMLQSQLSYLTNVKAISSSYEDSEIKKMTKTWDNYKLVLALIA
jgi:hypothetical protein